MIRDPLQPDPTPFELLGLDAGASGEEIKAAHKRALSRAAGKPALVAQLQRARESLLKNPEETALSALFLYDDGTLRSLTPNPVDSPGALLGSERETTALAWEQELRSRFPDPMIAHSLAVLWYWQALSWQSRRQDGEDRASVPAERLFDAWQRVCVYWVMAIAAPIFWNLRRDIPEAIRDGVGTRLMGRLQQRLHDLVEHHQQRDEGDWAERYRGLLQDLDTEHETAVALAESGLRIKKRALSCGPLLLQRYGLLDRIRTLLDAEIAQPSPDTSPKRLERFTNARRLLSAQTHLDVLFREGRYEPLLAAIESLPGPDRARPETLDIQRRTRLALGEQFGELGQYEQALDQWRRVWEEATPDSPLRGQIAALVRQLCTEASSRLGQDQERLLAVLSGGCAMLEDQDLRARLRHAVMEDRPIDPGRFTAGAATAVTEAEAAYQNRAFDQALRYWRIALLSVEEQEHRAAEVSDLPRLRAARLTCLRRICRCHLSQAVSLLAGDKSRAADDEAAHQLDAARNCAVDACALAPGDPAVAEFAAFIEEQHRELAKALAWRELDRLLEEAARDQDWYHACGYARQMLKDAGPEQPAQLRTAHATLMTNYYGEQLASANQRLGSPGLSLTDAVEAIATYYMALADLLPLLDLGNPGMVQVVNAIAQQCKSFEETANTMALAQGAKAQADERRRELHAQWEEMGRQAAAPRARTPRRPPTRTRTTPAPSGRQRPPRKGVSPLLAWVALSGLIAVAAMLVLPPLFEGQRVVFPPALALLGPPVDLDFAANAPPSPAVAADREPPAPRATPEAEEPPPSSEPRPRTAPPARPIAGSPPTPEPDLVARPEPSTPPPDDGSRPMSGQPVTAVPDARLDPRTAPAALDQDPTAAESMPSPRATRATADPAPADPEQAARLTRQLIGYVGRPIVVQMRSGTRHSGQLIGLTDDRIILRRSFAVLGKASYTDQQLDLVSVAGFELAAAQ